MEIIKSITVSIIIPTYNRAHLIQRALDSVIAQSFQDWECLVVDDGSTDNTSAIITMNSEKDNRIKYLSNEFKKGANGARNTGIVHAKGKYIAFLDSDDEWLPMKLSIQVKQMEEDEIIGLSYTDVNYKLLNGEIRPFGIPLGLNGNIYKEALDQGYIAPTSVVLVKRSCFNVVEMFDLELPASQDDDFCFKFAKNFKIGYIPQVLTYMNVDDLSTETRISNSALRMAIGWWKLWLKYEDDIVGICGSHLMIKRCKECCLSFWKLDAKELALEAYMKMKLYEKKSERDLYQLTQNELAEGERSKYMDAMENFCKSQIPLNSKSTIIGRFLRFIWMRIHTVTNYCRHPHCFVM